MDWKDSRKANTVSFGSLKVGDVFLCGENIIHIKVSSEDAFDICNNEMVYFRQENKVEHRDATLVLE